MKPPLQHTKEDTTTADEAGAHQTETNTNNLPIQTPTDLITLLKSTIEHNVFPMWIADAAGNMLAMNKACTDQLTLPVKDEENSYNILKDATLESQGFIPLIKNVFEKAGNARFKTVYPTNTQSGIGEDKRIEVNISPVTDSNGQVTHAIIQYNTSTSNERTEEALHNILSLTEATLESIHNGILVVGLNGSIIKSNRRFAEMWNIPPDIIQNNDDEMVMNSILNQLVEPEKFIARVMELYKNPLEESNDLLYFKDGRIFERISRPMFLKGKPEARVWSFLDITERKLSEEKLLHTSDLLERTAAMAKVGGWEIDLRTGKRNWSKETCRILEIDPPVTPELGTSINLQFYAPEALPIIEKAVAEGIANGKAYDLELPMITKNGRPIWVRDLGYFIMDDGKAVKVEGVMQDITERRKLALKMKQLSQAVEQSPVTIVITNTDGNIEYVNQKFVETTGYTVEEAIGKNPRILKSDDKSPEDYRQLWETLIAGNEWRGEFHNVKKNGQKYWEAATITPILNSNGVTTNFLAVKEDITQRKEAEEVLKKYAVELKNSNSDLENFAYIAGHDLHEPLRMVSSFLKLLEKKLAGQLDDTTKKYIYFAVDGADRMKKLIDALLQYSRVGANKEKFTSIDLNEVLTYNLLLLKKNINSSKATIHVKPLPVITANTTLINELFFNLINNAIKYRGEKLPEIEVGCNNEKDQFVFYVKDNGIGINPQNFDRIFIIFQRLHAREEYSGTGIGLSLCKKIVETHKGKIWVESEPGNGSTFFFSIPK
jgi:PAS domain S-box-containing protein